jgi:DNA-binding NarL/FixJ family response regulator
MKIVVADDHKLFRAGIISILEDFKDVTVAGQAADGHELIKVALGTNPDIILLDLNMPGMDGYQILEELKKRKINAKVIVVSMYNTEQHITRAIESGACGYLDKNADPAEIQQALESVNTIGVYFNETTNKAMLNSLVNRQKLHPVFNFTDVELTRTELTIIRLLAREMNSEEIAAEVCLSRRTVEGLRSGLFAKTNSKNTIGLVLWAVKNKLVTL